jgi:anti-sigma factor RsiW
MMHQQIEEQEIIERYVRDQLAPEEKRAFEEHFFSCEECFDKIQATERFVAGIRDAAGRGMLAEDARGPIPLRGIHSWWMPAFGVSACAAVIFAAITGWLYLVQVPRIRGQLSQSAAELRRVQHEWAVLEQQPHRGMQPEVNVPLAMLQATRGLQASPTDATLPADAAQLVLWIDVDSGHVRTYRVEISSVAGKPIETLQHLRRNSYNALAASVPAESLQPGEFQIKLFGEEPPPGSLLAEYRMRVRRP